MNNDTIYLDPDLFMALGFSAAACGGIGAHRHYDRQGNPYCVLGHFWAMRFVDGGLIEQVMMYPHSQFSWAERNDRALSKAGVKGRAHYPRWCRLVKVDIAE